jgi:hypothetical protein
MLKLYKVFWSNGAGTWINMCIIRHKMMGRDIQLATPQSDDIPVARPINGRSCDPECRGVSQATPKMVGQITNKLQSPQSEYYRQTPHKK